MTSSLSFASVLVMERAQESAREREVLVCVGCAFLCVLCAGYANIPAIYIAVRERCGWVCEWVFRCLCNCLAALLMYRGFYSYFQLRAPKGGKEEMERRREAVKAWGSQSNSPARPTTASSSSTSLSTSPISSSSPSSIAPTIRSPLAAYAASVELSPIAKDWRSLNKGGISHPDSFLDDSFSSYSHPDPSFYDTHTRKPSTRASTQQPAYLDFHAVQSPYRPAKRDDAKAADIGQIDRFSMQNRDLASQVLRDLRLTNTVETIYKLKGLLSRLIRTTLSNPVQLEKYRTFPLIASSYTDAVLNRLRVLSQGDLLNEYRWIMDRTPSAVPQDSQILMNFFFWIFFDCQESIVSPWRYYQHPQFVQAYYIQHPQKPSQNDSLDVCVYEPVLHPTHFEVVFMGEKGLETWRVCDGRENVFLAIILFVYFVKERRRGVVQMRDSSHQLVNRDLSASGLRVVKDFFDIVK